MLTGAENLTLPARQQLNPLIRGKFPPGAAFFNNRNRADIFESTNKSALRALRRYSRPVDRTHPRTSFRDVPTQMISNIGAHGVPQEG